MESATTEATAKPLLYIILGAAGSGRREVMADLIAGGLGAGDRPAVLISSRETEAPEPPAAGTAAERCSPSTDARRSRFTARSKPSTNALSIG